MTAEVRIADVLDQHDVNIYRQLAGGVTTANVLHGSCNADRRPERGHQDALGQARRSELRLQGGAARDQVRAGREPQARRTSASPGTRALPGHAHGRGGRCSATPSGGAQDYKREWDDYEQKVEGGRGQGRAAAGPAQGPARWTSCATSSTARSTSTRTATASDEILMLIQARRRVRLQDPHLPARPGGLQGRERDRAATARAPPPSPTAGATRWRPTTPSPTTPPSWPSHGVNVSLNSDADERARRLYWEAAKAVKYGGVAEAEALKMVTLNPAWQLGIDKRVGSHRGRQGRATSRSSAPIPSTPATRVEMTLVDGIVVLRPGAGRRQGHRHGGGRCAVKRALAAARRWRP